MDGSFRGARGEAKLDGGKKGWKEVSYKVEDIVTCEFVERFTHRNGPYRGIRGWRRGGRELRSSNKGGGKKEITRRTSEIAINDIFNKS